jgi:hypothetical protein
MTLPAIEERQHGENRVWDIASRYFDFEKSSCPVHDDGLEGWKTNKIIDGWKTPESDNNLTLLESVIRGHSLILDNQKMVHEFLDDYLGKKDKNRKGTSCRQRQHLKLEALRMRRGRTRTLKVCM